MGEVCLWGAVGASSLLVGAVVAYVASPSRRFIAIVMALGAGLLIGSVAFELIDEALKIAEVGRVGLFMLIGAATFTLGTWYLDRRGAGDRKDSRGTPTHRCSRSKVCDSSCGWSRVPPTSRAGCGRARQRVPPRPLEAVDAHRRRGTDTARGTGLVFYQIVPPSSGLWGDLHGRVRGPQHAGRSTRPGIGPRWLSGRRRVRARPASLWIEQCGR
jgi:hypothetical protein